MEIRKLTVLWAFVLLTACATNSSVQNRFTKLPTLKEQCEILSKKREPVKVKKSKRKPNKTKRNQEFLRNPEFVSAKYEYQKTSVLNSLDKNTITLESAESEISFDRSEPSIPTKLKSTPKAYSFTAEKNTSAKVESSFQGIPIDEKEQLIPGIEDNFVAGLIGISGLLGMLLLGVAQQRAMQISYWSLKNPWKARGIITAAHLVSGAGAFIIGDQLSADGFMVSETAKYIALAAATTAVCIYPITRSTNYLRPRLCEVLLFASGVTMMVYTGNHYDVVQQRPQNAIYSFASNSNENSWHLVKKEIFIPKQKAQDSPKSKGDKVGLTILASIGFTILEFFVAALSCSLSCNGSEAAAAIVGFGGTAGVIIGLFFVIKSIFRDGRKRKVKNADPPTDKS